LSRWLSNSANSVCVMPAAIAIKADRSVSIT
jgi:hypothetical protein